MSSISQLPHINVCICTFQRPEYLRRTLKALNAQETDNLFTYSVIVVDNDAEASARNTVSDFPSIGGHPVTYVVEPEKNISCARNAALLHASGDYIAFVDDDEYPAPDWLLKLLQTCKAADVDGVLGPVRPYYDSPPPAWVTKGAFFERPSHPTGMVLNWSQTRTGNVIFSRRILPKNEAPFRVECGVAGGDMDFFRRLMAQGRRFIWCEEAVVFEVVPPSRCRLSYLLKRALMRGSKFHGHPVNRMKNAVKSLIAVPAYIIALPFLALLGAHFFVKYLIKLCDHFARLLGFVGIELVGQRPT
ncbi:MAG TPA: glycosyltransferase family 2 protein [Terriglobales bacterium]|nr:glycosyltransferase family 2 protein [Terriglobales bacterium]